MAGIRCCIHAIGDEAQDMALLSLEKVQADRPLPDIRHRVEHLGNYLFTPERRAKAKRVHAVPVPNPSIFYFVGDMGLDYIGPNRIRIVTTSRLNLLKDFLSHLGRMPLVIGLSILLGILLLWLTEKLSKGH